MKRLLSVLAALTILFLSGCDSLQIGKFADALDRFSDTIDKTTGDGGNLDKRIKQLTTDMRKELVGAGKELTEDAVIKFAIARQKTIRDILDLTEKVFGETRVLMRELQGAGLSIPLQLDNSLKEFRGDLKKDLAGLVAPLHLLFPEKDVPLEYDGVTWSLRPEGFQSVWFAIKDAKSLRLKIGDRLIAPEIGPKAGSVAYRIPITPEDDALFDDTRDMALPFQLVDVIGKPGKEEIKVRYGGSMRLIPRFPIKYEIKVFPPGGNQQGEIREIDQGPAVLHLVRAVSNKDPFIVARRHGDIYRLAKSRLPVGTSFVSVPKGAHWELTVTFPNGESPPILSPDKRHRENEFGTVTVTGPHRKGDVWSLMVDVEPKK